MEIENLEDLKNLKTYTCGSPNQNKFLEGHGLKSVYKYRLSPKKNCKTMWVYIMTPELSQYLTEWTNNRPNNKIKEGE